MMSRGRSDAELVQLLKQGDDRAFDKIYMNYHKSMFAVAYAKVGNREVSEDIVQEIFISLWNRRKELEINNLEGYLVTSIKFLAITYLRRNTRQILSLEDESGESSTNKTFNPEDIYHSKYLDKLFRYQVDQLPLQCRLVFTYSRLHGMKTAEIASKMAISPKTVESHLTLALRRLGDFVKALSMFLLINVVLFFCYFFLNDSG